MENGTGTGKPYPFRERDDGHLGVLDVRNSSQAQWPTGIHALQNAVSCAAKGRVLRRKTPCLALQNAVSCSPKDRVLQDERARLYGCENRSEMLKVQVPRKKSAFLHFI